MANPDGKPPEPIKIPIPGADPRKQKAKDLEKWRKSFKPPIPKQAFQTERDIEHMESDFKNNKSDFKPGDFSACNGKKCPMEDAAQECGERLQRDCSPSNFGGRTMCGYAVAKMLECMKTVTGGDVNCTGACGHGKMFVDCKNGQMKKCGYEKVSATDNRCKMPGAVLAYTQSPTTRGAIWGHVEFVCGQGRYCSVYRQVHDKPWPRPVADACWFPVKAGGMDI